jgi:hypothetical protein
MNNVTFERVVTPYTLVNCSGKIVRFALDTQARVDRVKKAGGIILEDWETAEKVAFGLTPEKGVTLKKPIGIPKPLFIPHEIPEWASLVEYEK